jgi:hypothetical protein
VPSAGCFTRVDLELADVKSDPLLVGELRAGFADPRTLVLGTLEGPAFVLVRGQGGLAPLDRLAQGAGLGIPLEPLLPHACHPSGKVPGVGAPRPVWLSRPCRQDRAACVTPGSGPRRFRSPRVLAGMALGVFVEAGRHESLAQTADAQERELRHDGRAWLLFGLSLAFDPRTHRAALFARAEARASERPRLRPLPDIPRGPLFEAERAALTRVLCTREGIP